MNEVKRLVVIVGALLLCASAALAWPLTVVYFDGPQDQLVVPSVVHELGNGFPPDELILSSWETSTSETSCFDGSDDPLIANQLVSITNMTTTTWTEVWYVADPDTTITNYDGQIGPDSLQLGLAFKIDSVGINRPLVFESLVSDNMFQPGETWRFILQDWTHTSAPVQFSADFSSFGIGGASAGWPPSTGSIIAVPEPASLALVAFGAAAMMYYRRKK